MNRDIDLFLPFWIGLALVTGITLLDSLQPAHTEHTPAPLAVEVSGILG